MHRTHVTLVTLAAVLLAAGALSATFAGWAAGQSASAQASAPAGVTASAGASACAEGSTPALDQPLPVGTCIPAEDVESAVQPLSTAIGNTNCEKNAGNPHIATSMTPDAAKTVGGVIRCSTKKDYLYAQARLYKKEGDWYVLKDTGQGDCNDCYRKMLPAYRSCWNNNSNKFWADAYVKVRNNGNVTEDVGQSQRVTLNCGDF